MATAHKTHDHKGTSTLGVILNALNPFKKKSHTTSASSRAQEPNKSQNVARQASHKNQANKSQGKPQKHAQKSAHAAQAKKSHKRHHKAQNTDVNTASQAPNAAGEQILSEEQAVMTGMQMDPAHAPGHRKMNLEGQFNEHTGEKTHVQKSALDHNSRGDQAARLTSPQQRRQSPSRRASKRGAQLPKSSQ